MQGWNYQIAREWFPANCVFVGMLWSSFPSLQLLGVAMVTVLKNLTNLFTISGDIYFYNKRYNTGVPAAGVPGTNGHALMKTATVGPQGYSHKIIRLIEQQHRLRHCCMLLNRHGTYIIQPVLRMILLVSSRRGSRSSQASLRAVCDGKHFEIRLYQEVCAASGMCMVMTVLVRSLHGSAHGHTFWQMYGVESRP